MAARISVDQPNLAHANEIYAQFLSYSFLLARKCDRKQSDIVTGDWASRLNTTTREDQTESVGGESRIVYSVSLFGLILVKVHWNIIWDFFMQFGCFKAREFIVKYNRILLPPFANSETLMRTKLLSIMPILSLICLVTACGSTQATTNPSSSNQPASSQASQTVVEALYAEPSANNPLPNAEVLTNTTKDNPTPVGKAVLADNMKIVVISKVRPADSIVANGNMFTDTPIAEQEYMLVTISASCEEGKQCSFDTYNFKIINAAGVVNGFKQVTGVDGLVKYTTFSGGYTLTGIISFLVNKSDASVSLVYQSSSGDSVYLALP